jgi:hypothetical protein
MMVILVQLVLLSAADLVLFFVLLLVPKVYVSCSLGSSLLSWVSPKVKTRLIDTCHSQHVARLALGRLTAMADDSY